jgi:uncharacterized protein YndB with AHSA1/START domain
VKRDLRVERVYPQPPERVWRALTDRERVSRWLMQTDFEPRLGHEFTFRAKPRGGWNGVTYCRVTELDPPRCLAYTWRGGPGEGKPDTLDPVVRFTLAPEGTGTRLVLEQTGFSGIKSILVSMAMKSGWTKMMRGRLADEIARA